MPELDKDKGTVAFTLFIDPGRRVYVNRVNVAGNTKTRDEVVRREIRQMEGAYYDAEKINRSRDRLNRLGFFNEVNIETPGVSGTTDQVDVNVSVAEKSTGNVMLGAGFSSSEGLVLSGSVSQSNVFGTGNRLSAATQLRQRQHRVFAVVHQPLLHHSTASAWATTCTGATSIPVSSTTSPNYETSTTGAGVRFGLPVNERDFISFGLTYEDTSLEVYSDDDPLNESIQERFVREFGEENDTVRVDASWSRDTRNSFLFPTKGVLQRIAAEVGTPARQPAVLQVVVAASAVLLAGQRLHPHAERRGRGSAMASTTSRCRSSRTSTRAAPVRCVASRPAP